MEEEQEVTQRNRLVKNIDSTVKALGVGLQVRISRRKLAESIDSMMNIRQLAKNIDLMMNIRQLAKNIDSMMNIRQLAENIDSMMNIRQLVKNIDSMMNIRQLAKNIDSMMNIRLVRISRRKLVENIGSKTTNIRQENCRSLVMMDTQQMKNILHHHYSENFAR
jgi:predicted nuclease of restriction endonuclease-like (RecB) superfamily